MNKKIVVPKEILTSAASAMENQIGMRAFTYIELAKAGVEAALLWLSENPITPTDEQANELWLHTKAFSGIEHYAKAMARDWQRMMFFTRASLCRG